MRKFVMLLAAASILGLSSTAVFANEEAEAAIKACEQQAQAQGAADQYDAVMKCLEEKAQYEIE